MGGRGRRGEEKEDGPDVSLLDEGTSVVDGLGESALEDEGLETALEEVSGLQVEAVINAILVLREDTVTVEAAHEGLAFEKTSGVVLLEGKEGTGGLSDLGEGKVDAPDFTLATKAVLSAELELSIKTFTLKGATRSLGDLTVCFSKVREAEQCVRKRGKGESTHDGV